MVNRFQKAMRWMLGVDQRAEYNGSNPFYAALYGEMQSNSGVSVTENTALTVSSIYCAVRLLSETIAQLPIQAYRRKKSGNKEWLSDYPAQITLAREPNPWQTSLEWREMMMGHVLLRGNAYSRIISGIRGATTALVPLNPACMKVEMLESGRLRYTYHAPGGGTEVYDQDEIFHLRGLSTDGVMGISPVAMMREPFGLAKAAETYGASFFGNSARPDGFLTTDAPLKEDAAKQNRKMWEDTHRGPANAHRTAVLTNGLKWATVGMNNQDSQFLETREFSVVEIARAFRVPPHMIYDLKRATFSNIEHQQLEFATYSILPWLRRWEERINRDLITDQDVYIKFSMEGLLRGDMAARAEFYSKMIQTGIYSIDTALELEDMNPIGGEIGRAHWMQQQMVPLEILVEGPQKPEPTQVAETPDMEDDEVTEEEARELREANAALAVEAGRSKGEVEHLRDLTISLKQESADSHAKLHEREVAFAKQTVHLDNVVQERDAIRASCESVTARCYEQEAKCAESEQRCAKLKAESWELESQLADAYNRQQAALDAARKIALESVERNRRRECDKVVRASKNPSKFLEYIDAYYDEEVDLLTEAVNGALVLRKSLTGEDADVTSAIYAYVKESKRQLLAVSGTATEADLAAKVLTVTNGWEPRSAELVAQIFGKEGVENE